MPDDASRRRLTIADLKVIPRLAALAQREIIPGAVKKPFAIGQREPPQASPRPPARPAGKAAQPAPRPASKPVKTKQPPKTSAKPPATAYVPRAITRDDDGFPVGWALERYSWGFHRLLWREHGISLEPGEYTAIVRQCRNGTGEWLERNVWRVRLHSGQQIIVAVGYDWQPLTVLPEDWQAHTGWAFGLLRHMPKPDPVSRQRTEAQRAARRRKKLAAKEREAAKAEPA